MESLSNLRNGLDDDSLRSDGPSDLATLETRRRQKHLSDHEQGLTNQFKAAALQLTTLYRSSLSSSKESYEAGYLHALSHVLELLVRAPTSFPSMMSGGVEEQLQPASQNDLTPEQGLQRLKWLTGYLQRRIEAMSTSDDDDDAQPLPSTSRTEAQAPPSAHPQPSRPAPKRFESSSSSHSLKQQPYRNSPPLHTARFSTPNANEGGSRFVTPTPTSDAVEASETATTSHSAGKAPQTPSGTKRTRHEPAVAEPPSEPRRRVPTRTCKTIAPLPSLPAPVFAGGSGMLSTVAATPFNFKPAGMKTMEFNQAAVRSKLITTPKRGKTVRRSRSGRLRPVAGLRAGDAEVATDSEDDWVDDEADDEETSRRRNKKRRKSITAADAESSAGAQGDVEM